MKKQFLFLAGAAIILASCGSNNNNNQAQTQAQIDSTINAKLSEHDAANAAKNGMATVKEQIKLKEKQIKQIQDEANARKKAQNKNDSSLSVKFKLYKSVALKLPARL